MCHLRLGWCCINPSSEAWPFYRPSKHLAPRAPQLHTATADSIEKPGFVSGGELTGLKMRPKHGFGIAPCGLVPPSMIDDGYLITTVSASIQEKVDKHLMRPINPIPSLRDLHSVRRGSRKASPKAITAEYVLKIDLQRGIRSDPSHLSTVETR